MNVVTITPNTAVDVTMFVNRLNPGSFHRANRVERRPGGKGNNVARILRQFGHEVVASGFVGGHSGNWIVQQLKSYGIHPDFVWVPGESRTCYAFSEDSGERRVTEIVEPGITVRLEEQEQLLRLIQKYAEWADVFVLAGSLPNGVPSDYYARLIGEVKRYSKAPAVLDTSGSALREGLYAGPWVVKPNMEELRYLLPEVEAPHAVVNSVKEQLLPFIATGGYFLISMGADGLIAVNRCGVRWVAAPRINVVNTVGCGDALLAGFLHAYNQGMTEESVLRFAVACGSAAALQEVAGSVSLRDIENLLGGING
jgi:tagatose 6-phosphate kinase